LRRYLLVLAALFALASCGSNHDASRATSAAQLRHVLLAGRPVHSVRLRLVQRTSSQGQSIVITETTDYDFQVGGYSQRITSPTGTHEVISLPGVLYIRSALPLDSWQKILLKASSLRTRIEQPGAALAARVSLRRR
jgi:hypothetical protein